MSRMYSVGGRVLCSRTSRNKKRATDTVMNSGIKMQHNKSDVETKETDTTKEMKYKRTDLYYRYIVRQQLNAIVLNGQFLFICN